MRAAKEGARAEGESVARVSSLACVAPPPAFQRVIASLSVSSRYHRLFASRAEWIVDRTF
jgi:hypothetical protein